MSGTDRIRLWNLASMAMGLVATAAISVHLVNVVQPVATRQRVVGEHDVLTAGPAKPASVAEPLPGFLGPALVPPLDPGDVAAVRPWFAQERWWSIFAVPNDGYHLFASAGPEGPWVDTNTVVDDRVDVNIDVSANGNRLVVATAGTRSYRRDAARVSRFSWVDDRDAWQLDNDFPVEVADTGIASGVRVTVTDDGQFWLTKLDAGRILLAHLDAQGTTLTPFEPLPDGVADTGVGAYDLIAEHDTLRLVWRSIDRDQLSLASGRGASWAVLEHRLWGAAGTAPIAAAVAGPGLPGAVLMLVPTSLDQRTSNDRAPSVVLVEMGPRGTREAVVGVTEDRLSHPQMVLDVERDLVTVVAAVGPPRSDIGESPAPWTLTEKQSSITDLVFPPGSGEVLVSSAHAAPRSFVAGRTQAPGSGLVVAIIDPHRRSWITAQHGGQTPEPTTSVASSSLVHDSFEALMPGGPGPAAWYREEDGPRSTVVADDDGGGRALVVTTDPDAQRTTVCRALPAWGSAAITVRAEVRAIGSGAADAHLITVRGPGGALVAIRRSRKGMLGHLTAGGRVDDLLLSDGGPLVVTVQIRPDASTADVRLELPDTGQTKTMTIPYLSPYSPGPGRVCVSPAIGDPSARIVVRDLEVIR